MTDIERLKQKQRETERKGNAVTSGMATSFPRHPPPAGMSYSKNFARCQKDGRFAVQVRD